MKLKYLLHCNKNDPDFNLALEEYALRTLDLTHHDYLLFYINSPSVIIGKHQHTMAEINQPYVEANNIAVVRRISGGGAVYHDLGNLNFSFLTTITRHDFGSYQYFVQFIIDTLRELRVDARLNGRNDITIGNKKISGNAQYRYKDRMFSHGTLLFNTNLQALEQALKVSEDKKQAHAVQSILARVTNILDHLHQTITIKNFQQKLLKKIFKNSYELYELLDPDYEKIEKLRTERYSTLMWNYDVLPRANVTRSKRFHIGKIEIKMWIQSKIIKMIKFYGDFFSQKYLHELETLLTNQPYDFECLNKIIEKIDLSQYFGAIPKQHFLSLIMGND